jgi:hypothetical protein
MKYSDMCSKLRPGDKEIAALGPNFQKDWDKDFKPFPTRPLMLCGVVNAFLADLSLAEPGKLSLSHISPYSAIFEEAVSEPVR